MNFEKMKKIVQEKKFINPDSAHFKPDIGEDKITAYIDTIKYRISHKARSAINTDFYDAFIKLSLQRKAQLSDLDDEFILAAITIDSLLHKDYRKLLSSSTTTLKDMATAIAIVFQDLNILPDADNKILYKYFVNTKIPEEALHYFSSTSFISETLKKLLYEERVIFTWIIQNLTHMIRNSLLVPSKHKAFFTEIFKKQNYIQGEHAILFLEAITKAPDLFSDLAKIPLSIDPFSKQTNFTLWLQDSAKFLSLARLRTISGITATPTVLSFDQRLITFQELYKYDRSIWSR